MFEKEDIKYYNLLRDDVIRLLPKEQTFDSVLELGCGEGATLEYLKRHGIARKTTGVEIDTAAAKKAAERLDVVLHQSAEQPLDLPLEEFDLVLCLDVLEHLYNPWKVLADLKKHIKPGGYLLASIPNVQHWSVVKMLLSGRWDYKKAGLMDETHIRFFTAKTIKELFAGAGLKIVALDGQMGKDVRILDLATLRLFHGFFTYQYFILAKK